MTFKFNCTRNFKDNICSAMQQNTVDKDIDQNMQWIMHSFQYSRKNCVVAMHVATRYSILFADVKKMNTNSFFSLLMYRLYNEMNFLCGWDDMAGQHVLRKLNNHADFHYYHTDNRCIQLHINDVVFHFKDQMEQVGRLPKDDDELFSSGYFINRLLRSTVDSHDHFYPEERMIKFWKSFIDDEKNLSQSTTDLDGDRTNKIVSLCDYKKKKDLL